MPLNMTYIGILIKRNGMLMYFIVAEIWPRGYNTFFMLNSTEHEIFPSHKC